MISMLKRSRKIVAIGFMASIVFASQAQADRLLLQSTTSTQNSGLYDVLLPAFHADTGIHIHVVAVGTGKALANGRNCNGDALFIHALDDELAFVQDGYGLYRKDVMYNDFILVGPAADPAKVAIANNAQEAFQAIATTQSVFASRADDSGTHKREKSLWASAKINPVPNSGNWYLETGTGMGATLNLAVEKNAYVLVDRATWLSFANKQNHKVIYQGDDALFNQYGIIPINGQACPSARQDVAEIFAQWLISKRGQNVIASFTVAGTQLFIPNAR